MTSRSICSMALITIGPRQIIGVSSGTMKPMDMHLTPKFSIGTRVSPSGDTGRPEMPIMRGMEGP